jgi:type II secretory pathway pseudopilin PulG
MSEKYRFNRYFRGFSFLQLVIVIGIIAVLAAVLILIIKPAEIIKRAEDNRRINDINNLRLSLQTLITENATTSLGNNNLIYLSLPDISASCTAWLSQLPTLPSGWSYRCADSTSITKTDGTGWLPVNFQTARTGGIRQLPLDPINKPPYYYSYVTANNTFELTAYLAYNLNRGTSTVSGRDGGTNACLFEVGTETELSPADFETGRTGSCATAVTTNTPSILWAKTYGGGRNDFAFTLATTSDNALLVSGQTNSFSQASAAWVLKIATTGSIIWEKAYPFSNSSVTYRSHGLAVGQVNGGLFIGGYTEPTNSRFGDIFLLSLNTEGNPEPPETTPKTYGGENDDWARKIIPTSDGGFIIAGYTGSYGAGETDVWVIKLQSDGTIAWQKTYGSDKQDGAYDIVKVSDGYIVIGYTYSSDPIGNVQADILTFKIDFNGNLVWQRVYSGEFNEFGRAGIIAPDGNMIIVGDSNSNSFSFFYPDVLAMKINSSNGSIIWKKLYGGEFEEIAYDVKVTPNNDGYIIVGHTFSASENGGADVLLLKLDTDGNLQWKKAYGGNKNDYGRVVITLNDSYVIAGSTNSFGAGNYDIWLLNINLDGNINFNPASGAQVFEPPIFYSASSLIANDTILTTTNSISTVSSVNSSVINTAATVITQAP